MAESVSAVRMEEGNDGYDIYSKDRQSHMKVKLECVVQHGSNDPFSLSKNMMGILVYSRKGQQVRQNGAKLLLRNSSVVEANVQRNETMHICLYRLMYFGKTPQDDNKIVARGIVATGFSIQKGKLVFRSNTFNCFDHNYLDRKFYDRRQDKSASKAEEDLINAILATCPKESGFFPS